MSERLVNAQEVRNVDHAFDPAARVAQDDWDNYLNSRPHKDANGGLHSPESGQFMSNPNDESEGEYYSRIQNLNETDGSLADASLKDLSEMVRDAKATGDKTLELDARAAFDDKFMHMAEKHNWQGVVENADGTTTDRNAIADQKLAHYESIMNQEAQTQEPSISIEEPQAEQREIEPSPKHRAEREDEEEEEEEERDDAQGDPATSDIESKDEGASVEHEDHQETGSADNVDELNQRARTALDGFDELDEDQAARQNNRKGSKFQWAKNLLRSDQFAKSQLGQSPEDRDSAAGSESIVETGSKSAFARARDAINGNLTKLYYGVGTAYNRIAGERGPREDESKEDYQRRMEKYGMVSVAVGVIAVAAFSAYKISKGMDGGGQDKSGSFGLTLDQLPQDSDVSSPSPDSDIQARHDTLMSSSSWNIPSGSGGESLMDRLGADKGVWYEHQDEFLKQFPNEAYRMGDGNVGFNDPGKLSDKAIKFWAQKTGQW